MGTSLKKIISSVLATEHLPAHSAQLNGSGVVRAHIPSGVDLEYLLRSVEVLQGTVVTLQASLVSGLLAVSLDVTLFSCGF